MDKASLHSSIHTHAKMRIRISRGDGYQCANFHQKFDGEHAVPFFSVFLEHTEIAAWQTLADTLAALDVPAKDDV